MAEVEASGRKPSRAELIRFEAVARLSAKIARTADLQTIATASGVLDRLTRPSIPEDTGPKAEPYDHEAAKRRLADLLGKVVPATEDELRAEMAAEDQARADKAEADRLALAKRMNVVPLERKKQA